MLQKLLNAIRGLFGRKPSSQGTPRSQGFNVADRTGTPRNQDGNPPSTP
jgi:hypothetical protein